MKQAGQILLFRFPQANLEEGKLRPARQKALGGVAGETVIATVLREPPLYLSRSCIYCARRCGQQGVLVLAGEVGK